VFIWYSEYRQTGRSPSGTLLVVAFLFVALASMADLPFLSCLQGWRPKAKTQILAVYAIQDLKVARLIVTQHLDLLPSLLFHVAGL
jgi:hypothetical protein